MVAVGILEHRHSDRPPGRLAITAAVGVQRVDQDRMARSARARDDRIDVIDPEAEVMRADLEQLLRLAAVAMLAERLVEHDEGIIVVAAPAQVDPAPISLELSVTHVLDVIDRHREADYVAM